MPRRKKRPPRMPRNVFKSKRKRWRFGRQRDLWKSESAFQRYKNRIAAY